MPTLAPLADVQASEAAKKQFQAINSAFGMVPNIFRTMGHAPPVLQATLAMDAAIHQELDPKLRELAYLKASQVNECDYCLHYHRGLGKKSGLSDAQVKEISGYEQSAAYSPLEKNVLRFAEQWARQVHVDGKVIKELESQLTPAQLVTLAATVSLAMWTNRFNTVFSIQLP